MLLRRGSVGALRNVASTVIMCVNGGQYLVFLYVWVVFPAHDRVDNLMFCCQFSLEAIQLSMLANQVPPHISLCLPVSPRVSLYIPHLNPYSSRIARLTPSLISHPLPPFAPATPGR